MLLAGVVPGVQFDFGHGVVEVACAVEDGEEFAVADGIEGVEVAVREEAAHLVEEAVGHHLVHAEVDALVQHVGVHGQEGRPGGAEVQRAGKGK